MDWSKGYTAGYYLSVIDPKSWSGYGMLNKLKEGTISLSDENLRASADIKGESLEIDSEYWIRIYLDARSKNGNNELVPLFTGLTNVPKKSTSEGFLVSIECYSVLKPASDVLMPLGWYAKAGSNGARLIKELLEKVTPAPVIIEGESEYLSNNVVAESGETYLTMVDYILSIIGWRLRLEGDGTIVLSEQPTTLSAIFSATQNDILEPEVNVETNWFDCPNVFRASTENMFAVARDEDPDSFLSIPSRGREVWMEESDVALNENETLSQYANRRLKEEQKIVTSISYKRRFDPNVKPTDIVDIRYSKQNIDGLYYVKSQKIELSHGTPVSEEVSNI